MSYHGKCMDIVLVSYCFDPFKDLIKVFPLSNLFGVFNLTGKMAVL